MEALTSRTAQLPQIDLPDPPRSVIGANTIDCMKSGVLYGTASMLDGMIDRYKKQNWVKI
ncbi:MAG: type III pantothenate kinase [Oscillospiraceae bacterium]